jgi:uncharacterized membrane protein YoaK (UPF0700 family)
VSRRDLQLLALTAAAGWLDAVGYAGLGHVFTANMTGNLILLGLTAVTGGTVRPALAAGAFALGALGGALLTGGPRPVAWTRLTGALAVELAALVCFAGLWALAGDRPADWAARGLLALAAAAMGVQSAAASRLAVPGVTTTYVTGTMVSLMAELAALAGPGGWALRAAVLSTLLVAATVAAVTWSRSPVVAAFGPAALVALVVVGARRSRGRPRAASS